MKTIRLLLVCVLASIGLVASAQSYLPQKNAFSVGGGFMWGMSEGKGDFQDVAGTPTCGNFGLEFRHYPIPNIGLGVAYNRLSGNKDGNKLRRSYTNGKMALGRKQARILGKCGNGLPEIQGRAGEIQFF